MPTIASKKTKIRGGGTPCGLDIADLIGISTVGGAQVAVVGIRNFRNI